MCKRKLGNSGGHVGVFFDFFDVGIICSGMAGFGVERLVFVLYFISFFSSFYLLFLP